MSDAAEWTELSNCFYRVQPLPDLQWQDVDLSELMVACAPYGGPIATVRDPNHLPRRGSSAGSAAGSAAQGRQYISVFSAAGRPISRFLWEPPGGRLMGLGWREDAVGGLVLVTVLEDGTVHQCSMHGKGTLPRIPLHTTNLEGIMEAHIFGMRGGGGQGGNMGGDGAEGEAGDGSGGEEGGRSGGEGRVAAGVVCLTESCQLLAMVDFDDPEVFPLADPGLSEPPACMAVLEPVLTSADDVSVPQVAVLLGTEAALLRADGEMVQRVGAPEMSTAVQCMAVSASGKLLACFTADGQLHVLLTSDLSRRISHYDTQTSQGRSPTMTPRWVGGSPLLAGSIPPPGSIPHLAASPTWQHPPPGSIPHLAASPTWQHPPPGSIPHLAASPTLMLMGPGDAITLSLLLAHTPLCCPVPLCLHASAPRLQIVLPPDAMAWCGEDAVLLSWQHPPALMLVGPGDAITHSLPCPACPPMSLLYCVCVQIVLPPDAMAWCGEDAVLLSWQHPPALMLVGPVDAINVPAPASALDTSTSTTDSRLVLIPECDGVRLLSSSHSDFISRVPEPTVAAFALASTAPPALLLEAFGLFERRSGKADEHVRAMGPAVMGEAVRGCMHAAAHETDVDGQKRLLSAAAFGRAFCRKFPRDRMMSLCKDLRVLNAVRRAEEDGLTNGVRAMETAGMPLTYSQYKELTPARLIARLCSTHHHLLALRVAAFLGLRTESVLEHWAISKILSASQMSNEVLYDTIIKQIDTDKRGSLAVSFAAVATVAFHTGRHELATRLLEREVHTGRQVRLLLEMGAFEAAVWKAEAGPDAEFVFQVLFQLLDKVNLCSLACFLLNRCIADGRKSDIPLLMRFYERSSMHQCVAEQIVDQGILEGGNRLGAGAAERVRELEAAAELLSRTRDHGFQAKAVEDSVKLLRFQQQLEAGGMQLLPPTTTATATGAREGVGIGEEEGRRRSVVGASVNETIAACLAVGNHREAQKLKSDFKVPERRFYWLRLQSLARLRDWEGLEKLFKERRPLVGLRAFVEACVEQGAVVEAAKYVGRIADAGEREELSRRFNLPDLTSEAAAAAAAERGEGAILVLLPLTQVAVRVSAAALPCSKSPVAGFAKKVTLAPGLVFHWKVLYGNTLRAAIIAQASSGANKGWVAVGWTKAAGKMYPADAVVGNLGSKPGAVEPYAMTSYSAVTKSTAFTVTRGIVSRKSRSTVIRFTRSGSSGLSPINYKGTNNMVWAYSVDGSTAIGGHGANRGSATVDLACKIG
ncbi:unnamed protein product [Closterium sp. Yama58-4]|nr:unnamed protein product [Closterium sp. Yama58-4]